MAQQETEFSRGWIWGGVAVVALLVLFFVVRAQRASVTVTAAQVERRDLIGTVSTNGNVEPMQDFQAIAAAPGIVQKIFVSVGEHVQKGQELVKMDDTGARKDVASAQANLASAEATLANMKNNGTRSELLNAGADKQAAQSQLTQSEASLRSLQQLQSQGAASANEVAAAQQRVKDAQSKIDALNARSSGIYNPGDMSAQNAQVSQAHAALIAAESEQANVDQRSPFSGTVYAIPVAEYDYVKGDEELLDVADLSHLQVRAYFDEPEIGGLAVGQPVKIIWDAKPNQTWHGHIIQAPTRIVGDNTRHVGECLISVDDAKGDLLPNTNVTVMVTTMQRFNVLSLPREALHAEGTNYFVYKLVDNRLVKTPVSIATTNLTRFEVTSGLKEGDTVALSPTAADVDLTNGLKVKVQP